MKRVFYYTVPIFQMIFIFSCSLLTIGSQNNAARQEDPNAKIFMTHLQNNWDDIHDVIMRFHYEDPELKGIVLIQMNWQNSKLFSATIESNSTGNDVYVRALINAMKKWTITGLTENWTTTLPIKTEIVGCNEPEFPECGILTGKVLDKNGKPIQGAKLSLTSLDNIRSEQTPIITNREGVFIKTLIPSGNWSLEYTKDGYLATTIEKLSFNKGEHVKRSIVLKK